VVLHQLLGWHHVYDRSTLSAGLLSDGLFHLFSTAVLVFGSSSWSSAAVPPPRPPSLALAFLALAAAITLAGPLLLRRARQPGS
jgi:uncharacterized membrane protein